MTKLLGFVGGLVGSYAGWYLGMPVGIFTAFFLSTVAGGVGIYYGRKLGRNYE